jgi:hypothetical protein
MDPTPERPFEEVVERDAGGELEAAIEPAPVFLRNPPAVPR